MEDKRQSEILSALISIAGGNFDVALTPTDQGDVLDGICLGVKMLAEEIKMAILKLDAKNKDLKQFNENLEQTVKSQSLQLIQNAKMAALGQMAGGIAHEINNPIGVIHGKARLLLKYIKAGRYNDAIGIEELEKIVLMADRAAKIVTGLRSFSRNAEKDPITPVNMDVMITNVLSLCGERFNHHQIKIEINSVPNLTLECRGVQLEQVVLNLLNNAHDAVVHLAEKWVRLDVAVIGGKIQISVTDSGKGLPPHIVEKLMQPFFTTKEVGKGTGLGLSISKGIIEDHHGHIRYDSLCPNTRFVIELPMKQPQQELKAA